MSRGERYSPEKGACEVSLAPETHDRYPQSGVTLGEAGNRLETFRLISAVHFVIEAGCPNRSRAERAIMQNLPTGTVTLLFTDIAGSTRLLHQLGDRYASMLLECRQVLRAVFEQWNGNVVDTQGHPFFVAFPRAPSPLSPPLPPQPALPP